METETIKVEEFKSGLTKNSILAIIYASLILMPALIYMRLMNGTTLSVSYIAILLFTELAINFGKSLTKQEVTVIFYMTGVAANGYIFLDWCIRRGYWVVSPLSKKFGLHFPTWWAPPADSQVYQLRTLFHIDWLIPILILLTAFALQIIIQLSLGLLFAQLFIEVENLPFPLQLVDVAAIETLTERKREKVWVFAISSLIGGGYAFILYGIPTIMGAYGRAMQLIPIPWADGTFIIEQYLPGASIGIATDLSPYVTGFVIPFTVVVWQFIGSIAISVVGNHLALTIPHSLFKQWQEVWLPGSNIEFNYTQSYLYLWVSPLVGLAIAAALGPIVVRPKYLASTFKGLWALPKAAAKAGYLSLKSLLAIYLGASIGLIILYLNFIPDFPLLFLLIVVIGWPFIYTMINARSLGLTGYQITIPGANELILLSSGYPGIEKFLVPVITGPEAASWVARLKVCKLTQTTPRSLYGAYVIAAICSLVFGFIYVNIFWAIAPIPSMFYPYTMFEFPLGLINGALWLTGKILSVHPEALVGALLIGLAVQVPITLFNLPVSLLGFYLGAQQPVPIPLATLIGGIVGRYLLPRFFGEEWWNSNRTLVTAGVICGEVVISSLVAAISLLSRALWALPF